VIIDILLAYCFLTSTVSKNKIKYSKALVCHITYERKCCPVHGKGLGNHNVTIEEYTRDFSMW